jgi:hypothetical protein
MMIMTMMMTTMMVIVMTTMMMMVIMMMMMLTMVVMILSPCRLARRYDQAADVTLVHYAIRIHASFTETFELQQFPFDRQALHVLISLYDNPEVIDFRT